MNPDLLAVLIGLGAYIAAFLFLLWVAAKWT